MKYLLLICFVMAAHAKDGQDGDVFAKMKFICAGDEYLVNVTFVNQSVGNVLLPRNGIGLGGWLTNAQFTIFDGKKIINYLGPTVDSVDSPNFEMTKIRPNEDISFWVNLSHYYKLNREEIYSIAYKVWLRREENKNVFPISIKADSVSCKANIPPPG